MTEVASTEIVRRRIQFSGVEMRRERGGRRQVPDRQQAGRVEQRVKMRGRGVRHQGQVVGALMSGRGLRARSTRR